ncbi:preprotein translocase subunit SecD [Propionicimonas paludicola]|uniref:Protein translocase subunit SecD n=1 Tax=Propionicimonas paludicola TaxID=185243 RepID=A0A2A9CRC5_9ACTN|nr:protein translocase subunit SecD [Propionicimonas paludicola]PFG16741.1 preprotein translocase subunit SecD [Propionicimonas paludicola]
MATSKHHSHSLRTLVILALVIGGMFTIMAVTNAWAPKLGLDLRGGTTITLTAKNSTGDGRVDPKSLELARTILQQRVDANGVGETEVTTSGETQIIVTAPNVQKDDLLKLVGQTAQLYFRMVYAADASPTGSINPGGEATPSASGTPTTSASPATSPSSSPSPQATESTNRRPLPALPTPVASPRPTAEPAGGQTKSLTDLLAWTPSDRDNADFAAFKCGDPFPDVTTEPLIACDQSGTYKYLLGPALIKGSDVSRATAGVPQNSVSWEVELQFNPTAADQFFQVTKYLNGQSSPKNQFGIVLDGKVISSPEVTKGAIAGGRASISGNFTQKSASDLATVLSYGALPLTFDLSSVENVSAKLGIDQLHAGIIAGLIGLGLVLLYSILYYRGLAVVVSMSLVVAALLTWSSMVLLGQAMGFALNLPGVAGAIVAIGVTADSFIIYFERIRDEVREGRSLRTAIETGWVRSRKTILAADSVSLLSALVLFILAIGAVKGFAFTLGLTTLIDIVVVFCFTKPLMTLLGKTKFFGEGHRFSGFEAEHMGATNPPLHNSRRKSVATVGGETR